MKFENQSFDEERALFREKDSEINNCKFSGKADGESPLKETEGLVVNNCSFDLRYALWHTTNTQIKDSEFSELARAPFWYDKNILLSNVTSHAPKAFRECKNVLLKNSKILSEEPFWKISKIVGNSCEFSGFYAFFMSSDITLEDIKFEGKYSFQYCDKVFIKNSTLNTKDAFWHSNNVYIENCVIKGEYIAWYSKNLTFVNCTIESHQSFCHADNIKLVNCKMPNCDLSFEDTSVTGNIIGKIDSIKNPRKAKLVVDEVGELIEEEKRNQVFIDILK